MKHSCRTMIELIKEAKKSGYEIKITKKYTYILKNKNGDIGTFHISPKGYHPLRRWMKNNPPYIKNN